MTLPSLRIIGPSVSEGWQVAGVGPRDKRNK